MFETRQLLSATGLEGLHGADDDHSAYRHEASELEFDPASGLYSGSGIIGDLNDTDTFRLVLTEPAAVDVLVNYEGPSFGPGIVVQSIDVVYFDIQPNEPATFNLDPGEHYITTSGTPDFEYTAYQITVTVSESSASDDEPPLPPSGDDHSHLLDQATLLEFHPDNNRYSTTGIIGDSNDQDLFRLDFTEPTTIDLLVDYGASGSRPIVSLFGNPGSDFPKLHFVAGDTVGLNLAPGAYFVSVSGIPGMHNQSYHVLATVKDSLAEEDDHADQVETGLTHVEFDSEFGGWIFRGRFHHRADQDYFQFEVTEPTVVVAGRGSFLNSSGEYPPDFHEGFVQLDPGTWFYLASANDRRTGDYSPVDYEYRMRMVAPEDVAAMVPGAPTEDDHPNNVISDLRPVPFDSRLNGWLFQGTIEHSYDEDVFAITVHEAVNVAFNEVQPDVGFRGLQPDVVNGHWRLTPGEWYVYAMGSAEFESGDYEIWLQIPGSEQNIPPIPDDHPNYIGPDVARVPFDLETGTWHFDGTIEHLYDRDIFAFTVEQSVDVVFESTATDGAGFFGVQPQISGPFYRLTPGTWYIQMNGAPTFESGDYTVTLTPDSSSSPPDGSNPPIDIDDPVVFDDHPDEINPDVVTVPFDVENGAWVFSGTIEHLFDRDVFEFIVTDSVDVTFTGEDGSGFFQTQPAIVGGKYRLTPGVWYIQMNGGPAFSEGHYTITLQTSESNQQVPPIEDDHSDNPDTGATVIDFGSGGATGTMNVSGRNESTEDMDVFQFDVTERSRLNVSADHSLNIKLLDATGQVIEESAGSEILRQLRTGRYFVAVSNAVAASDYRLNLSLDSIFVDAVNIARGPNTSLSQTPAFYWNELLRGEFEVFIGYRGQSEAVYRTRGINETQFQVPENLGPGEYVAWVRWYSGENLSRWGIGHDFVVSAAPEVTIGSEVVTWTSIESADRYEVQISELADDGSYIQEKAVVLDDLTVNQFTLPEELRNKRLAVWVRAIRDNGGTIDRTGWSRAAMNHDFPYSDPVAFTIVNRFESSFSVRLPVPAITAGPTSRKHFEIYVALADDRDTFLRIERDELTPQQSINNGLHSPGMSTVDLPAGFRGEELIIWVRSIGEGLRKSRWGQGQFVGLDHHLIEINPAF